MGEVMKKTWTQPEDSLKALDSQGARVALEQNGCLRIQFFKILFGVAFCHHLDFVGICYKVNL